MAAAAIQSQLKKIKPSAKNVIEKYKEVFEQALKELKSPEEIREGAESFLGASKMFRFFSSIWLSNVYGMKTLWCSSTVRLLSTLIWVGEHVWVDEGSGGASVQFGCYQHKYEWMFRPHFIRLSLESSCKEARRIITELSVIKDVLLFCFGANFYSRYSCASLSHMPPYYIGGILCVFMWKPTHIIRG